MALSCGLPHAPRAMANAGAPAAPAPDTPRRRPGTGEPGRSQEPAAPAGAAVRAGLPAVDLRTGAVRNARHTTHETRDTRAHEHTNTTCNKEQK